MNKRILVPYDASPSSIRALDYAVQLAEESSGQLIILNVQFDYNTRNIRKFAGQNQVKYYQEEAARQSFESAKEILEDSKVEHTFRKRLGIPDQVILEEAANEDIDLIVMGTRGVGRVKGAILGSVSYNVLQSADLPVTIVP
ncbi:universal stress protein [Halobacillus sp. A5]|uniref:universal stress protein n=1 Tax=Halobacillus sp. A5 TaxID=2880263 RepID=UPI0020A69F4F|nr:universal stress protein [Halobacillus sp. A5]MCP3026344.1 universal stress protein [Halobacillus sp. A5]